MGRIFTAQPVFHYRSDTAKAQHRPVGLLCQQLLWDGAEPLGSALGQTQRKADNGIKESKADNGSALSKTLCGLVLCTLLVRDGVLLK